MEKNSVLIISLVALTAIVTMITKIIELMAARLKYKKEATTTPASVAIVSQPIQYTRSRSRLMWDACVVVFTLAAMFWFMFGPLRAQTVTVRDVMFAGICIV